MSVWLGSRCCQDPEPLAQGLSQGSMSVLGKLQDYQARAPMPPLPQHGQDSTPRWDWMTLLLPGECAPWVSEVRQQRASRMVGHMAAWAKGSMWWAKSNRVDVLGK